MTVIGRPEPVGEPVQNGYALELRRLGAGRGDLTQARDAAVAFIRYDRQIHGTPDVRV